MPPLSRSSSSSCVDIDFTLKRQFNKTSFRPGQREIILAALDKDDVYVQAATSFGKSLCYQLPAVIDHGITIVISPLLSLMMNQVEALRAAKVDASTLNSQTPYPEKTRIYIDLASGHPRTRLLYVTPELCSSDSFQSKLKVVYEHKELARIVVDEAHCISEWGHEFRKDFERLSWFREAFPDVPIMCLTATATAQVRKDVLETLGLLSPPPPPVLCDANGLPTPSTTPRNNLKMFIGSAFRPNLHLEVRFTSDNANTERMGDFISWIKTVHARRRDGKRKSELDKKGARPEHVSGIIYTTSRAECGSLASDLCRAGIGAKPFHAGLPQDTKEKTLSRWINNDAGYEVVVATTAFGMGIDKDDVRFVVHWRLPKSFEGYYQEVGRAGRDGNASYCFLYYSREDRDRTRNFLNRDKGKDGEKRDARRESLEALVKYCESYSGCRHSAVCNYFGEIDLPACDYACDWHKDSRGLQDSLRKGLATEEFVLTQREEGRYDCYDYYSE